MALDDHPHNVVETSPDGRYLRYDVQLGKGAFKEVYKAFDTEEAMEVAWNAVSVRVSPQEREKLRREVAILKSLDHPNIIALHESWVDPVRDTVNFITEVMTSGTLKQYTQRMQKTNLKVIKKWCRQILTGLKYLHEREPPVIHRDLKCDNIFINGNSADVKIGDLGLATFMPQSYPQSVIGTPEFMAPELYDENYNEKVDIWSFGMCVLEMVTREYPYSECQNAAQIFKKVSAGKLPAAFDGITDPGVKAFISSCLCPAIARKSAADLLMDPFLRTDETDDAARPADSTRPTKSTANLHLLKASGSKLELKLLLPRDSSGRTEIGFEYDLDADSPEQVAAEIVQENIRCPLDRAHIASEIREILAYVKRDTPTGDQRRTGRPSLELSASGPAGPSQLVPPKVTQEPPAPVRPPALPPKPSKPASTSSPVETVQTVLNLEERPQCLAGALVIDLRGDRHVGAGGRPEAEHEVGREQPGPSPPPRPAAEPWNDEYAASRVAGEAGREQLHQAAAPTAPPQSRPKQQESLLLPAAVIKETAAGDGRRPSASDDNGRPLQPCTEASQAGPRPADSPLQGQLPGGQASPQAGTPTNQDCPLALEPPVGPLVPPADVRQWTETDVVAWVRSRGALARFADCLSYTDGRALLALSEADLERLGVDSYGARHRLLNDIAALRPIQPGPAPSTGPPALPEGYKYHAFITYRRIEGRNHLAALLKSELDKRGYSVFYDRQSLQGGAFDSAILQALRASCCDIFVLLPGTLDRCKQDRNRSDWVRLEIAEACHLSKVIIPVVDDPQQRFPDTSGLPADMANFPRHNALFWSSVMETECVAKICTWLDRGVKDAPPFGSLPAPLPPGGSSSNGSTARTGFWASSQRLFERLAQGLPRT